MDGARERLESRDVSIPFHLVFATIIGRYLREGGLRRYCLGQSLMETRKGPQSLGFLGFGGQFVRPV